MGGQTPRDVMADPRWLADPKNRGFRWNRRRGIQ
jgi:hypothetical protein